MASNRPHVVTAWVDPVSHLNDIFLPAELVQGSLSSSFYIKTHYLFLVDLVLHSHQGDIHPDLPVALADHLLLYFIL